MNGDARDSDARDNVTAFAPLGLVILAAVLYLAGTHAGPFPGPGPGPSPSPLPAPDPATQVDAAIRAAVNNARAGRHLPPLAAHAALKLAADRHAADMAAHNRMSHYGSDRSTWIQRCRRAGYPGEWIGENVAEGFPDVSSVMAGWMDSPGHRAAILGDYEHCAAARATGSNGRIYWVIDFGRP